MCAGQIVTEADYIKFLGMQLDNYPTWRTHIGLLLHELHTSSSVIRRLFHVLNIDAHTIIYFAYFHSLIKCINGENHVI